MGLNGVLKLGSVVALALSLAACATVSELACIPCARFQAEYSCQEVTTRGLPGRATQVSGCGHTATYACLSDRYGTTCIKEADAR